MKLRRTGERATRATMTMVIVGMEVAGVMWTVPVLLTLVPGAPVMMAVVEPVQEHKAPKANRAQQIQTAVVVYRV